MSRERNSRIWVWALSILIPSILSAQVDFTVSNLPIILIDTDGEEIVDDPKITANMKVIWGEGMNHVNDTSFNYNGQIGIEIRGSSSQGYYPKKQYGLETQNPDSSNNDISLLGMPEENDWILSAPYADKSLIRNILAYTLSNQMGFYAPKTQLCEVVINGEYAGVYVLTEKIKRDENRVDISSLNEDDINGDEITGGYIIKIDKPTGTNCNNSFYTEMEKVEIQYEYPKCDEITESQMEYINRYIEDFEYALYSEEFADPSIGFRKYIDLESYINMFICVEISKNVDGYNLSTFLNKDRESVGGKLRFGPIWDYNLGFGNSFFNDGEETSGLIADQWWKPWCQRLFLDSTFSNEIQSKYSNAREDVLSDENVIGIIDSLVNILHDPQARNFQKWDVIDHHVWPNFFVGNSYYNEVEFLKWWFINRLAWLDNNLQGELDPFTPSEEYNVRCFPNPANKFFSVNFTLEEESTVSLKLIDMQGRILDYKIVNEVYSRGEHNLTFYDFLNTSKNRKIFYYDSLLVVVLEVDGKVVHKEILIKKD